jgi:putative tricarboxylic transport membrane protein
MNDKPLQSVGAHPDRIGGLVLCAIGAICLWAASPLPFGKLSAPDAGFFPLSLSAMLLVCGVVLFASSFRSVPEALDFSRRTWLVILAAVALILYAVLLERVGFVLCTIAVLFLLMRAYGQLSWTMSALLAVTSVVLVYFLFIQLGVPLPRGPLPF